ncbi:unnamed protein product [Phytomonas sp. EM1]|nr:unnamed protein product [Phytomonas sp. EM1]|eukprot:CCW65181.1 unnamed protein product [Phytomonas sp. isolate EM1]
MANHGFQKGQWRGEDNSHGSRKSLLEENKAVKASIHGGWPSSLECFNERGLGPDVAASRSLKFLKDDFLSAQVAPSRAEKFPVSSMDANMYKKFSWRSLRDGRKKSLSPSLKPEVRRKDREAGGGRSSFYRKNVNRSHTSSRLCSSPSRSSTPVCVERLPNLVSVYELSIGKSLNRGMDQAEKDTLSSGLRSSFRRQSDKVILSYQNSGEPNKSNYICSTFSSPGSDSRGNEILRGNIPSAGSGRSMNQKQENGETKGTHDESNYLARKCSLSLIVGEDQSSNEVVWRTIPTSITPAMRRTPSGIYFCSQYNNDNIRFPYLTEKQLGSNTMGDRSKESSGEVVWVRFPSLLHRHPTTSFFKRPVVSHSKSDAEQSFHDSKYIKCFDNNGGKGDDHFNNQLGCVSSREKFQVERLNSLRGRSLCKVDPNPCRTWGTDSCTSGILDDSLIDDLKSESALHSLCTMEASSLVEGRNSFVEPHIVANRKGTQTIVNANGVPARVLPPIATEADSQYDVRTENSDLGKEFAPFAGRQGRVLPNEMKTLDTPLLLTELNSSRINVASGVKNANNIDQDSSIPYSNSIKTENIEDFESLKRTVATSGKCAETQQPAFPHKTLRTGGKLGDKSWVIRNPQKDKVKKINQTTIELLRSIYLGAPGTRAHHPPLPGRVSPHPSLGQLNRNHDFEIESYLDHFRGNTEKVRRESTGKKSERFQSLIKSEDPFSYLLGLHGFWGETNYY